MFLKSGIERILGDRDIKRRENAQLKLACETALGSSFLRVSETFSHAFAFSEELKAEEERETPNGNHLPDAGTPFEADRYFLPFELACNSKSPKIVITALDCLQKLIAYGHLTGQRADTSNPERKLIDRIVEAICAPFLGQGTDEDVLLQLIKVSFKTYSILLNHENSRQSSPSCSQRHAKCTANPSSPPSAHCSTSISHQKAPSIKQPQKAH